MEAQREAVETVANGREQKKGVHAAREDGTCLSGRQARQIRRRGLLAAALALGAGAVAKLATPGRAEAVNNDNWQVGTTEDATFTTRLDYTGAGGVALRIRGTDGPANQGIFGSTGGSGNMGIEGANDGPGGIGVQGDTFDVTAIGVRGVNPVDGTAIKGVSNTGFNLGADGNGSGIGVHGKSSGGNGVLGQSNSWYGVGGSSNTNVGVYGSSNTAAGVYGTSTTGVGVYGNSVGSATGVFGAGTNYVGGYFQSTNNIGLQGVSFTPNVPAIYGVSTVAPGATQRAAQFDGNVIVNGNFSVTGAKAAVVPHPDGTLRTVYCLESPESYFEDFGEAALAKGVAAVALDPDFAVLVQTSEYHVFLTPRGDCRGLYVSNETPQGFEVRELQGGASSLPFSYRVVAKRKDVVAPRLEKLERDRVRAFGLKQHSPPPPLTLPPDQVLPQSRSQDTRGGPQVPPGVPQVPPGQPQVPPGRR